MKTSARRLASLDLNLLLSLDALLQERNVTRAAARLGLSQPAVSAALAKLRRHFADELLIRVGNQYELTPLWRVEGQLRYVTLNTRNVDRHRLEVLPV